jgi:O-antigen ligase
MAAYNLHPLMATFIAFGPLAFSPFANSLIAQIYLGLVITLSSLVILDRAATRSLPSWTLFLLMAAGLVMIGYWALVVASGSGVKSVDTLKVLGRLSVMPLVTCAAGLIDWRRASVIRCVSIAAIILLSLFASLHVSNGMKTGPVFMELHSNFLGITGGFAIVYAFYFRRLGRSSLLNNLLAIVGFVACVCSVSRASYVVVTLVFVFYFFYRMIGVRPMTALPAVGLLLATAITISLCWSDWVEGPTLQRASEISMQYLGKPLDTGRAAHWHEGKQLFERHPWIGIGTQAHDAWTRRLENGETLKLSIHNYYYAVLHEAGILGLALVLTYIMAIVWTISTGHNQEAMSLGIAFLLAILIHQIAEVSLTTGSFMVGIAIWCVLGGLLSGSRTSSVEPQRIIKLW